MRARSLLQPRVATVLALVNSALSGEVVGVHDFRVAARSLRAALLTVAKNRRGRAVEKTRRTLQTAIRLLADPRDRDVGRVLLMKRSPGAPEHPGFRRRVTGVSERERRVARLKAAAEWPKDLDRRLIRLLEKGETSVETVIRRSRAEAWRERRRAIEILRSLGRRYDADRLHDLRRRVRSLRYAMEVLAEVDSTAPARVIHLKPLQSALGNIQDRSVLSLWLSGQADRLREEDPRFADALTRESARFRDQSLKAHAAFLKLKPATVLERLALHVDPHTEAPKASSVKTRR